MELKNDVWFARKNLWQKSSAVLNSNEFDVWPSNWHKNYPWRVRLSASSASEYWGLVHKKTNDVIGVYYSRQEARYNKLQITKIVRLEAKRIK